MDEPLVADESPSRRYASDRIAGALMIVGFLLTTAAWIWSVLRVLRTPGAEDSRFYEYAGFTLTNVSSKVIGLAIQIWYSLGVAKGRNWAFVLAALVAAQGLVPMSISLRGTGVPPWSVSLTFVFFLGVFLYGGLRALGSLGPRSGDPWGFRDPIPDSDR